MSLEDSCIILDDDTPKPPTKSVVKSSEANDSCILIEDDDEDIIIVSQKKGPDDEGGKPEKTISKSAIQKKQAEENKRQRLLIKQQKEIEEKRKKAEREVRQIHTASRAIFYCVPIIDQKILHSIGDPQGNFLNTVFDENEIRHKLVSDPNIPKSISWVRIDKEVVDKSKKAPAKDTTSSKDGHFEISFCQSQPCTTSDGNTSFRVREFEKEEDRLIVVLTAKEYIDMLTSLKFKRLGKPFHLEQPLDQYLRNVRLLSGGKFLTVMVYNLNSYFKLERAKEARSYKRNFIDRFNNLDSRNEDESHSIGLGRHVTTQEEADSLRFFVDLELKKLYPSWKVQFRFFEKTEDIVDAFSRFTRAVAYAPFKQSNVSLKGLDGAVGMEKLKAYDPAASPDDLKSLWINQLQVIPQITPTMAVAIADVYPCPMALETAYRECSKEKGENLLSNIRVQRNVSQRDIGQTLSKRVYTVLTSRNPDDLLCENQI